MEDIVQLKTAIVAYKTLNVTEMSKTNIVQFSNPIFLDEIHKYNTRLKNKEILYTPFARTRLEQTSLDYQVATIWNKIPLEIRKSLCLITFKKKLKNFLIEKYASQSI